MEKSLCQNSMNFVKTEIAKIDIVSELRTKIHNFNRAPYKYLVQNNVKTHKILFS